MKEAFVYFASDPIVVGIITWVGLIVTVGGFAIGLRQLRKVKVASLASLEASEEMKRFVKSRSSLADLVAAVALIETVKAHVNTHSFEASLIYIGMVRERIVSAKRLMRLDEKEQSLIEQILQSMKDNSLELKQMALRPKKEVNTLPVITALEDASDALNHYLAPLKLERVEMEEMK